MKNLNELRSEYVQMPNDSLQKIAINEYAMSKNDIKSFDTKTLIDNMIAIEFNNYYKSGGV